MKFLLSLFLSMNLVTACRPGEKPLAEQRALPEQTILNVAYGKDSLQKMDIYLPANRTSEETKSLILIHGGGWNSGSKADFALYIDSFKRRLPGYAIFNINYRLVNGGHLFPTQENDVKAALDFISEHAENYQVSKNKLALLGVSAGAHLALLQAYKYASPDIQAVIDYFGPTDLVAMYEKPWHPLVPMALQTITGTSPEIDKEAYQQSSPAHFVNRNTPPTLLLHGARDMVVDVSQSKLLASRLEAAGVPHELVIYPQAQHGRWHGHTLTSSFDRIEKFLQQHVR